MGLQGQDEADETREALGACNAIGGAIEFTSVSIDVIKVLYPGQLHPSKAHSMKPLTLSHLQAQDSSLI